MRSLTRRSVLRLSATAVAGGAVAAMASSCSSGDPTDEVSDLIDNPDPNINTSGMPIVKEKTTLRMMSGRPPSTAEDWNQVKSIQRMEELSNIHVDWGLVPYESMSEKRNLAMASGDYPGILYRTSLGPIDLAKYGEAGTLLPLNRLIDEYMPNLKALVDANEEIRKGITFPDGNIYGAPTLYDPEFHSLLLSQKLWIRKDWLDKFGMEPPTTLEEFEAYLEEVKGSNPAPKGTAIPFSDQSSGGQVFASMMGPFGLSNRGRSAGNVDLDESGALRYWPASDGQREAVTFLNRLYGKGLIQSDVFSAQGDQVRSLGRQGLFGAFVTQAPVEIFGDEEGEKFMALPPLKKSAGDEVPQWPLITSPVVALGNFVLTDKCEHPIEAARWMDYWYGDEGNRLFFMGIEGVSYEKEGDSYEYVDEITDNPDGLTPDEARKPYVIYIGGGYPGIVLEEHFKGWESTPQAREGTAVLWDHRPEEVWAPFTYTTDEATEMNGLTTDLDKLTAESRDNFITGKLNPADWDKHVAQYENAGLPRYMEIQQAALDRYQG